MNTEINIKELAEKLAVRRKEYFEDEKAKEKNKVQMIVDDFIKTIQAAAEKPLRSEYIVSRQVGSCRIRKVLRKLKKLLEPHFKVSECYDMITITLPS